METPPAAAEAAFNPYAPPAADLGTAAARMEHPEASLGKRFLNFVIDRVAIMLLVTGVLLPWGIFQAQGDLRAALTWTRGLSTVEGLLVTSLATCAYYALFEGHWGRTPGKWLTGTRVLTLDGGHPGWPAILRRSAARLVPLDPLSFLGSTGWHDAWSGTQVVDLRKTGGTRLSPALRRLYR